MKFLTDLSNQTEVAMALTIFIIIVLTIVAVINWPAIKAYFGK